ncbi:hypothetical protein DPX16_5281 [Anabarilius grahami]|uniref:Uncharacterized protein n=1 Tax=Anabarilius grahami TaxID=495550 RepID=A0A3N0XPM5_ANAGA|nr:hypothetical protein DPX16_5281 [Anabarilius grahami]
MARRTDELRRQFNMSNRPEKSRQGPTSADGVEHTEKACQKISEIVELWANCGKPQRHPSPDQEREKERERLKAEVLEEKERKSRTNAAGESHTAKMRIISNGVQPYIVQTGVDTDGETQEEVTTFTMKLDVSECLCPKRRRMAQRPGLKHFAKPQENMSCIQAEELQRHET